MFIVYAERETDRKLIVTAHSLNEATSIVDMLESHDLWPEGYDAIAAAMGARWMLTSDGVWERLDPLVAS